MNSLKNFIRAVLLEGDKDYNVLGGTATSLRRSQGQVAASASEKVRSSAADKLLVDNIVAAVDLEKGSILDDVNFELRGVTEPAGVSVTDDEELQRFRSIATLLAKDIESANADTRFDYPYRTALYTIGWRNGVQSSAYDAVVDMLGLGDGQAYESFIRSWNEMLPDVLLNVLDTQKENLSRLHRNLLEEAPEALAAALVHAGAEGLERIGKSVGVTIAKDATTDLSTYTIREIAAAAADEVKWGSLIDLGGPGGNVLTRRLGQNVEKSGVKRLKYGVTETIASIWQGVDVTKLAQIIGQIKLAIKNVSSVSTATEQEVLEEVRQVVLEIATNGNTPTPARILDNLLASTNPPQSLEKIRELANSGITKMTQGIQAGALTNEERIALKFMMEISSQGARLARASVSRLPLARFLAGTATLAIVTGTIVAKTGIAIEAADFAYIDADVDPESLSAEEVASLLSAGKIRREAGDAQQFIRSSSGLSPTADDALLKILKLQPFEPVTVEEMQTALTAVQAVKGI